MPEPGKTMTTIGVASEHRPPLLARRCWALSCLLLGLAEQAAQLGDFRKRLLLATQAGVGRCRADKRDHGVVQRSAGHMSIPPINAELARLTGRVEANAVP